ncbi:hypothetical protein RKD20_005200 [Streptomyces sp. SLBN-8D4]
MSCSAPSAAVGGGRWRGGGEVHVVVEEFDDGQRAGQAGPFGEAAGALEGLPGVEDGLAHGPPVRSAAPLTGELPHVDDEHLRLRGRPFRAAQHPQVQRDVVRRCRPDRQGDHGAQGTAAQQVGAGTAAGAAGGCRGRHEQHTGAAVLEAGEGVLDPGELGLGAGREAVLPAGVVGEFVVAPVALVERRVAQDGVGAQLRVGVGAQGVAGGAAHGGPGVQGESERGERGEFGGAVLRVELLVGAGGGGPQEGAGAAGRVEDGAGGAGEVGHEAGQVGGRERVLARVGVQVPAEQELEGLAGAQLGGQLGDTAQEGGRGEEFRTGGGVNGGVHTRRGWVVNGVHSRRRVGRGCRGRARGVHSLRSARGRLRPESRCEHLPQRPRQHLREAFVGTCAQLQPNRRAVMDQQQHAARVDEGGDRAVGVAGELLPDAFPQWDLGEFPLRAQPGLDFGEREGRAGLAAADGPREVGVPTAPVADGRAAHAGHPRDTGGGHLSRVVLHPSGSPRRTAPVLSPACDAEHTDARKIYPFTAVYTMSAVNSVDSVHSLCSY